VLSCLDYNLFDAFRLLDLNCHGHITQHDLLTAFQLPPTPQGEELNLPQVTADEISLFFKRWDRDGDGRLKFSEFTDAMYPQGYVEVAEMLERRNANPPGYPFSGKTMEMYRNVWLLSF
jgi:hypothetical protein